jgi:hypothetical protein
MAGPKGFTPKAKVDLDGVQKVLELRSVYGEPRKALTDPTKYMIRNTMTQRRFCDARPC